MFTWMWTKKYGNLSQRLQVLKETREENIFSPDLSTQTLTVAPQFWERQHGAFLYVDQQIKKLTGKVRVWSGMAFLALLADGIVVVGGLAGLQAYQSFQADRILEQQTATSASGLADGDVWRSLEQQLRSGDRFTQMNIMRMLSASADPAALGLLFNIAKDPGVEPQIRHWAIQAIASAQDPRLGALEGLAVTGDPLAQGLAMNGLNQMGVQPADPSLLANRPTLNHPAGQLATLTSLDSITQAIYQLGQSQSPEAIPPLLAQLSHVNPEVRVATVNALTNLSLRVGGAQAWEALHNSLATESDMTVRQATLQAIANLSMQLGFGG